MIDGQGYMAIEDKHRLYTETNLQHLSRLNPEEAFDVLHWLFYEYVFEWSDSKEAVIDWLSSEYNNELLSCDRDICLTNEYNNIGCEECQITIENKKRRINT